MAIALGNKNVGDIIKIKENGALVDFIIVHKGIPSGVYDASCDGVWVLRRFLVEGDTIKNEAYDFATGKHREWLENTYYNMIDTAIRAKVKNANIPYTHIVGENYGGVSCVATHCFNLQSVEIGVSGVGSPGSKALAGSYGKLSYFTAGDANTKKNDIIAYRQNGEARMWWIRDERAGIVTGEGGAGTAFAYSSNSYPMFRPAMILDYNTFIADDGSVTTNTAPTTPASISVPGSIRGGSNITISWAASSDAQGNLEGYKLERSINGGASWDQIYQGGGTSITNNVAYGTNTVMYRVKAYDSMGLESGYTTSQNVAVVNNTAPGAPQGITVPHAIRGGSQVTISWGPSTDAENNLAGYELERSVNGGAWTQVYRNAQRSYTDNITFGWNTVAYRVRAYDAYNAYSGYATSETRGIDNNRPPEIASEFASGSDLGIKGEGFSITYTVTDPDNNTGDVTVIENLDSTKKKEFNPELGAVNTFAIEGTQFQCLPNGQHNISVTASDGKLSCTHILKFTKQVTSAMVTLETPLEADDQITACAIAVSGYIPEDAQFRVLVTNNANDTEVKWENCTQLVKDGANYVFSNQNAENGYAFNFKINVSRGESGQGGYITSVQGGFQ